MDPLRGQGAEFLSERRCHLILMARHHTRQKVHYLILRENKVFRSLEGNGTLEYLEVTQMWGVGTFVLGGRGGGGD